MLDVMVGLLILRVIDYLIYAGQLGQYDLYVSVA